MFYKIVVAVGRRQGDSSGQIVWFGSEGRKGREDGTLLRLVAPDRWGFQWVKWVLRVEVRTLPGLGEIIASHTHSPTPKGHGEGYNLMRLAAKSGH